MSHFQEQSIHSSTIVNKIINEIAFDMFVTSYQVKFNIVVDVLILKKLENEHNILLIFCR